MSALVISPYTGWRPRSMREGRNRHESDRGTKRARLGNRHDRQFYISPKGYKQDPARYARICRLVDGLNRGAGA